MGWLAKDRLLESRTQISPAMTRNHADRFILQRTAEVMHSAVRHIEAIADWAEKDGKLTFGGIAVDSEVDALTRMKPEVIAALEKAAAFIADSWNEIDGNSARMAELRRFLDDYGNFRRWVIHYDDLREDSWRKMDELLDDRLQPQEYVMIVARFDRELEFPTRQAEQKMTDAAVRKFWDDIAEAFFQHKVSGLNGSQWEDLIMHRSVPIIMGQWGADKKFATYFGKRVGLECLEMNQTFTFPREDDRHRNIKLDYYKNRDDKVQKTDWIATLLDEVGIDRRKM